MKKVIGWLKIKANKNPVICLCHPDKGIFIRNKKPKKPYLKKGWKMIKVEIKEIKNNL